MLEPAEPPAPSGGCSVGCGLILASVAVVSLAVWGIVALVLVLVR